jgi:hypothetical protein
VAVVMFCFTLPCGVGEEYRHFEVNCCFCLQNIIEDGGTRFLRNVAKYVEDYKAS